MSSRHSQRGFSLVTAIFLITVLAALGTFLLVTSGVAQQTPVMGLRGAQAYHAARSGLDWGIGNAINNSPACPGNQVFTNLQGYDITVTWTCTTHTDDSTPNIPVYVINSVATTNGIAAGSLGYAQRTLRGVASPSGPL